MKGSNGRDSSLSEQKKGSQERMLEALGKHGAVSLEELAAATGLARGTVHAAVRERGGLDAVLAPPREVRLTDGPGGRATSYFGLKPYVALGVDLDHDRVRVCITDIRGADLWREHTKLAVVGRQMQMRLFNSKGEVPHEEQRPLSDEHALRARLAPQAPDPTRVRASTSGAVDNYPGFALYAARELVKRGVSHLSDVPPAFWLDNERGEHPAVKWTSPGLVESG